MDEHRMEPLPKPAEFGPLARDQFVAGFDAAMRADEQCVSDEQVGHSEVTCEDVGSLLEPQLADHPMYRALLAARNHFGAQVQAFQNFVFRFLALVELASTDALRDWIQETPEAGDQEIHPAVIYACAEVRLTEDGQFPVDEFLQRTQQITNEEFDQID